MYIEKGKIKDKIQYALRGKMKEPRHFMGFADRKFYLPTLAEFKRYIQIYQITVSPHNPVRGTEGFDCDVE